MLSVKGNAIQLSSVTATPLKRRNLQVSLPIGRLLGDGVAASWPLSDQPNPRQKQTRRPLANEGTGFASARAADWRAATLSRSVSYPTFPFRTSSRHFPNYVMHSPGQKRNVLVGSYDRTGSIDHDGLNYCDAPCQRVTVSLIPSSAPRP